MNEMSKPPFKPIAFMEPAIEVEERADGTMIARCPVPLGDYPDKLGVYLKQWAEAAPDRVFLADRAPDGSWNEVSYAAALDRVERVAQGLLDREVSVDRPVMILSDNAVDNGILQLAAMHIGVPAVPVSPAYSLMSQDHAKLKAIAEAVTPGLIYAANGQAFAKALAAIGGLDERLVISTDPPHERDKATRFHDLTLTEKTPAVDAAFDRVGPDTIAKVLFTSGSTGMPKGVINTQRMLVSNQQMIAQCWPFLEEKPPVVVDWLPWNHTFGANHNFNMVLRHGGTLYIDNGKPTPQLVERTVANLREVSPTVYFNVPLGFGALLDHMEKDAELRASFFKRLDLLFYAGAALPQALWERLERLSVEELGQRVPMVSAWGSTETSPMVTTVHFPIERAGVIGLPAPGAALKLVPNAGKLEMRVSGPNVTPGYWRRPDLTREAFDEEGYYLIGDAGRFADPDDPAKGIVFDGRTAENFKLSTGTWVHVGQLRVALISACAPVVQDAVITGENEDHIGVLLFPNLAGARKIAGLDEDAPAEEVIAHDAVRQHVKSALAQHNLDNPASSMAVSRALILTTPPSQDANEITDKGYINQRAVRDHRAEEVARIIAGTDPAVILVSD
jgi:feruloyl-CoA synthase